MCVLMCIYIYILSLSMYMYIINCIGHGRSKHDDKDTYTQMYI